MNSGTFRAVGKRGRKQSFPLQEPTANERVNHRGIATALLRRNDARRSLVDATAAGLSRIVELHRLFDLGRISGNTLLFRQLHLAVLFPGNFWRFATQLVWAETELVAELASVFAGAANSLGAGRISAHLLLL